MTKSDTTLAAIGLYLERLRDERRHADWASIAASQPQRLAYYLAAQFEYDVRQGGFAQLIFNMQGACLAEIEDMLIAAGASIAREAYVRAIRACLEQEDDYHAFLASNYTDACPLKNQLHRVALDYLARDVPFVVEASDFLANGLQADTRRTE